MFLTILDIDTLSMFLAKLDTIKSVDRGRISFLLITQNSLDTRLSIQISQFEVVETAPVIVDHLIAPNA